MKRRRTEKEHPGALASQWIPNDPELWKIENYPRFLEARQTLLAEATNAFMVDLLHGEIELLGGPAAVPERASLAVAAAVGGVESAEEESLLLDLNRWVTERGLARGQYLHELADPNTGQAIAVLDLAWPEGLQEGLSEPVAVLLNEGSDVLACASRMGFRCFTEIIDFRRYVQAEVLVEESRVAAE